jgi:hypothetical protein
LIPYIIHQAPFSLLHRQLRWAPDFDSSIETFSGVDESCRACRSLVQVSMIFELVMGKQSRLIIHDLGYEVLYSK